VDTLTERDPRVPYRALADAEMKAREKHPDALSVRALWTPSNEDGREIHVEVWTNGEDGPCANVVPA
jgi:hypothetical protein